MDLDSEIASLKRRVSALEQLFESGPRTVATEGGMERARRHLEAGELDEAGNHIGLQRSHEGTEPNESFLRRLKAAILGEHADTTGPVDAPEAIVDEPPQGDPKGSEDKGGGTAGGDPT